MSVASPTAPLSPSTARLRAEPPQFRAVFAAQPQMERPAPLRDAIEPLASRRRSSVAKLLGLARSPTLQPPAPLLWSNEPTRNRVEQTPQGRWRRLQRAVRAGVFRSKAPAPPWQQQLFGPGRTGAQEVVGTPYPQPHPAPTDRAQTSHASLRPLPPTPPTNNHWLVRSVASPTRSTWRTVGRWLHLQPTAPPPTPDSSSYFALSPRADEAPSPGARQAPPSVASSPRHPEAQRDRGHSKKPT